MRLVLWCQGTLLSPVQTVLHPPGSLAAELLPSPAGPSLAWAGATPAQGQDLVFAFAELHKVPDSSFLHPAKVPLNDSPAPLAH